MPIETWTAKGWVGFVLLVGSACAAPTEGPAANDTCAAAVAHASSCVGGDVASAPCDEGAAAAIASLSCDVIAEELGKGDLASAWCRAFPATCTWVEVSGQVRWFDGTEVEPTLALTFFDAEDTATPAPRTADGRYRASLRPGRYRAEASVGDHRFPLGQHRIDVSPSSVALDLVAGTDPDLGVAVVFVESPLSDYGVATDFRWEGWRPFLRLSDGRYVGSIARADQAFYLTREAWDHSMARLVSRVRVAGDSTVQLPAPPEGASSVVTVTLECPPGHEPSRAVELRFHEVEDDRVEPAVSVRLIGVPAFASATVLVPAGQYELLVREVNGPLHRPTFRSPEAVHVAEVRLHDVPRTVITLDPGPVALQLAVAF